jgi:hypothetical protein
VSALGDWDALEASLKPVPRFTVEPRDKGTASEIARQSLFLSRLRMAAPDVLVWAVPNGHNRGLKDRAKAKREGLKAGVPDLTICWNHGTAFLEFKSGIGAPDDNQVELLNHLTACGHRCAVVRTPEFALALLAEWGAPIGGLE